MEPPETDWFRTFFDERYLRQYEPALPAELTVRQIDELIALLGLEAPSRVLDLACGHGRHAIELARRGYDVTGLDLSEVFLDAARRDADAAGVSVAWTHGDMRRIPFEAAFDVVVNLFTAFGYFEEEADDVEVLRGVARALRPGGRLLVETIHRDALLRKHQRRMFERYDDAGILILHENRFDLERGRIDDEVTLVEHGRVQPPRRTSVRLYTVPEWRRLLGEAGLELDAVHGGLGGTPLTLDSWRLAVVARRPA